MARKKRTSPGSWSHSTHEILGGKAQIYKVKASGDVWQFRQWVPEEQKYVRRSLKTKDLPTALEYGETLALENLGNVAAGKRIFGVTLGELVERFVAWRAEDVPAEIITAGRLKTIESQVKHVLAFKGADTKLKEISENTSFFDYQQYRMKIGAKPVTVRNEQATLNQMFAYGFREQLCPFQKVQFRKLKISGDDIGTRGCFTLKEYDQLIRFMRTYVSKKACPDDIQRQERLIVRDAILIASNTLLRVGEWMQLKWGDVEGISKRKDSTGRPVSLVTINVRAETSKVRKTRRVISRGGEFFERLKKNSHSSKPEDLCFREVDGSKVIGRRKWDIHWKNLMDGIGLGEAYSERKLTYYTLRSFGITARIMAGNSYNEIAVLAGTSQVYIENHYAKYNDLMKTSTALKNFNIDEHGIIHN